MKNKLHILIPALVLIVAVSAATDTEAGIFGKSKQKEEAKTWRFHRMPTMNFATGTVARDIYAGWTMGETRVVMAKECQIVGKGGETVTLEDGDNVMVMGPRAGDTIVAWQIRVLAPSYAGSHTADNERVQWSESDSSVGEGTGPQ